MMAGFARGMNADEINRGTHEIFVRSRAFRRLTVPQYALLDHKVLDRTLQAEYGDVLIEDLWLPFSRCRPISAQGKRMSIAAENYGRPSERRVRSPAYCRPSSRPTVTCWSTGRS